MPPPLPMTPRGRGAIRLLGTAGTRLPTCPPCQTAAVSAGLAAFVPAAAWPPSRPAVGAWCGRAVVAVRPGQRLPGRRLQPSCPLTLRGSQRPLLHMAMGAEGADVPSTSAPPTHPQLDEDGDDDVFVMEESFDGGEEGFDSDDEGSSRQQVQGGLSNVAATSSGPVSVSSSSGRRKFGVGGVGDVLLAATLLAVSYGLVWTSARVFSASPYAALTISTSLSVLPWYAAQSLTRMVIGYVVSLLFSVVYAYTAYRVPLAAQALMLVIDVLQSIPLLSFLPAVVLGLIALFPGTRMGVELAAVLLLFTSMAWNMVLGFYQSLCGIPRDLVEVSKVLKMSAWKRFWVLEAPAGVIGLVWNSIMSVAGGWFFLISIESFTLGNRDFRLPGLGSFLAVAAEAGDYRAIGAGLAVVIALVVAVDFLLWRPLIAWSSKFNYGGGGGQASGGSAVLSGLRRSSLIRTARERLLGPAWHSFVHLGSGPPVPDSPVGSPSMTAATSAASGPSHVASSPTNGSAAAADLPTLPARRGLSIPPRVGTVATWLVRAGFVAVVAAAAVAASVSLLALSLSTWLTLLTGAVLTFARVLAALALSLAWTVPVGVAIGRDPKLAARVQPLVQIAASVPATALFPFLLVGLAKMGGGLGVASIVLMLLGTMWYVLFNVIAGAQAIPGELFEVEAVYGKGSSGWQRRLKRWRTLILPGIFPYLMTGVVTAVGGAWNASIVSEYVVFRGGVMSTRGLGATISAAAASGEYGVLLGGTALMAGMVLATNRLVWSPLIQLANDKYKL
ncbi:hypothetical protein I4F81_000184 [Pyropia yezoensis]|uniref:Uncharacterized protein n=1 Tax=Pyropia yezoensis TaxID=2788 RepID=A0ACC3BJ59_PYRYE|nr:hypothetical protein I4F81_000184 [Neopyropia yezoensis]